MNNILKNKVPNNLKEFSSILSIDIFLLAANNYCFFPKVESLSIWKNKNKYGKIERIKIN